MPTNDDIPLASQIANVVIENNPGATINDFDIPQESVKVTRKPVEGNPYVRGTYEATVNGVANYTGTIKITGEFGRLNPTPSIEIDKSKWNLSSNTPSTRTVTNYSSLGGNLDVTRIGGTEYVDYNINNGDITLTGKANTTQDMKISISVPTKPEITPVELDYTVSGFTIPIETDKDSAPLSGAVGTTNTVQITNYNQLVNVSGSRNNASYFDVEISNTGLITFTSKANGQGTYDIRADNATENKRITVPVTIEPAIKNFKKVVIEKETNNS